MYPDTFDDVKDVAAGAIAKAQQYLAAASAPPGQATVPMPPARVYRLRLPKDPGAALGDLRERMRVQKTSLADRRASWPTEREAQT